MNALVVAVVDAAAEVAEAAAAQKMVMHVRTKTNKVAASLEVKAARTEPSHREINRGAVMPNTAWISTRLDTKNLDQTLIKSARPLRKAHPGNLQPHAKPIPSHLRFGLHRQAQAARHGALADLCDATSSSIRRELQESSRLRARI